MKLNGKNIITDQDITVTGGNNPGNSLSDVLQSHDKSINSLKGEIKWLYKYGGTGSGGGGGAGGGSTSWAIYAVLGGRTLVNGGTVSLTQDGNSTIYTLNLSIKNGNGNYSVTYYYDKGKFGRLTLNPENGWKASVSLNLPSNDVINIVVSDGSEEKNIETNYVTNPYTFSNIKLVNDAGLEYQNVNKDIFISNAISGGLNAKIDYSVSIEATVTGYWEVPGFDQTLPFEITDKSGSILVEFPKALLNNDLSGLYEIKCTIIVQAVNQEPDKMVKTSQFNLIPETLYLKVAPEIGNIYNEPIIPEDAYQYKTGSAISLTIRAYYGNNQNRTGNVSYTSYEVNNDGTISEASKDGNGSLAIVENQNSIIQISYLTPGWKKLVLKCTMDSESYTVEKFIYIKEVKTNYDWYKTSIVPNLTTYYRRGVVSSPKVETKLRGSYHQMFTSGEDLILDSSVIETPTSDKVGDILISLGIQYNEINNTEEPIASFNYNDNGKLEPFCTIYQNKVIINNNTVDSFIGKTESLSYNPSNTQNRNYHLVQVLLKHTYSDVATNNEYKQACVYIDGVLEGSVNQWFPYTREISNVTLHKGNYSINLLEVANFSNWKDRVVEDVDINYYYNTYLVKTDVIEEKDIELESMIIDSLYEYDKEGNAKPAYSIENNLIKLYGSQIITQISSCLKVPTLVCKTEKELIGFDSGTGINKTIFDWMNTAYEFEQDSNQDSGDGLASYRCPVSLRWYNRPTGNGSGISFDSEHLITGAKMFDDANTEFYLRLQGSSTMRYKAKNFTLGVRNTSEDQNTPVPLFSPNFNINDKSTFLPDNAFTLKADMVDSSHSNNTSLGKFINDVYTKNRISDIIANGDLKDHVKSCLEGFPILLFLEVTNETGNEDPEYYYLGIYNFNLGRENYLNLGYMDLEIIQDIVDKPQTPNEYNFTHLTVPKGSYTPYNNLIVAEVQGNNPLWDFSQYQDSVLFKIDNLIGDSNYMFGDIVYGSGVNTSHKEKISKFVKSVSGAGNYIFNNIGKTFKEVVTKDGNTDATAAYRLENTVPDCDIQYTRNSDGQSYSPVDRNSGNLNPTRDELSINILGDCIVGNEQNDYTSKLNYNTAIYYYTLCMAFGLVDSVQKNLNIKSWNGETFGLYFYDMDTALGLSNSGGKTTSYFCFSDYWKTSIIDLVDKDGNVVYDSYGNPVKKNLGVSIMRDYYPEDPSLPAGYDIPSTYLFAVSKYAACFNSLLGSSENIVNLNSPQNLWGTWRQKNGILESADNFVTNYFQGHLSAIPETLINLNYRNKYLYGTVGTNFNDTDHGSLKGRQVERVKDWLASRFHILDAYFNLGREKVIIHEKGTNDSIQEPICSIDSLNTNSDIQILHDIFSPVDQNGVVTVLNRVGPLDFNVKARNYTPLIHKHATNIERFLLEDENTEYNISVVYNGSQTSKFGGSEGWTYLNSLNSFIQTLQNKAAFNLSTKKLENIEGTEGELTGDIRLNIPAARTLKLTSPNYSCRVTIDSGFINLTNVDISGSKIDLNVNGSQVITEIKADNVNTEGININSCSALNKVSLTGSTIKKLTATPIWNDVKDNFTLNNAKITELILQGRGGNLVISNSPTLKNLTISGFKTVKITGCPNLSSVTSNDTEAILESVEITGAVGITSIILVADNITTLNLSGCTSLNHLELRKLSATDENTIKLEKLSTLNISNTRVDRIIRPIHQGNSWVESDSRKTSERLYITDYPGLKTFVTSNNPAVKYIQFPNEPSKAFVINNNFANCTSLLRVFGRISINTGSCFSGCSKFSIHGYYTDDEGNILLYNPKNTSETIRYNGVSVLKTDSKEVIHPRTSNQMTEEVSNGKKQMKYQSGNDVTNIVFSTGNTNVLSSAFFNTSCTIFDIYYIFQNISGAADKLNASGCFYNKAGYTGSGVRFEWNEEYDNSPYREMFYDWGEKIGSISETLRGRGEIVRLFSTVYQENGSIEKGGLLYYLPNITTMYCFLYGATIYTDNNVFKSSTGKFNNLTNINYFSPRDFITGINDAKYSDIFSGKSYNTTFLYNNFKNKNDLKLGNLNGLLNQCPAITSISNCINTTTFIDFDKAEIGFPASLKSITYSFICSYGFGELNLGNMFIGTSNNTLNSINQSFRVNNSAQANYGDYLGDGIHDVEFIIDDYVFSKFTALSSIGFTATGLDAGSEVLTSSYSSFNGTGLKKKLRNGELPYNIVSHLKNLKVFTGFFRDINACDDNGEYKELSIPGELFKNNTKLNDISRCFQDFKGRINLTGESFSNCPELSNASYLFCITNPTDSSVVSNGTKLGIISSIPYKFFYHGEGEKSSKTIIGSNKAYEITISEDDRNLWTFDEGNYEARYTETSTVETTEYIEKDIYSSIKSFNVADGKIVSFFLSPESYISHISSKKENGLEEIITETSRQAGNVEEYGLKETTVVENIVNIHNTIKDVQSCFQGHGWIQEYNQVLDNIDSNTETNPSYQPYDYLYNSITGTWNKATDKCDKDKTNMWFFDGNNTEGNHNMYYGLDEDVDENAQNQVISPNEVNGTKLKEDGTKNFFCPPDLFRYCTEDANISSMFYHSGYSAQLYLQDNTINNSNYVGFGIKGRICPYLLKPVPKTTSLYRFLTYAKKLSHYTLVSRDAEGNVIEGSGDTYLIPKTFFTYATGITNLEEAFKGFVFNPGCKMDVFKPLTGALNLDKTFQHCYFQTDSKFNRFSVSGLFIDKSIKSARGTFTIDYMETNLSNNPAFVVSQNIDFGINFTKSKLPTESNTDNLYVKHVYDGFNRFVEGESSGVSFTGLVETEDGKYMSNEFKYPTGVIENPNLTPFNYRTRN